MATPRAVLALASALAITPALWDELCAADLGGGPSGRPVPNYSAPPLMEVQRWTGLYVGATGGYTFGDNGAGGDIGSFTFEQDGFVGTLMAGYNWQIGSMVLGAEADIGAGDLGTSTDTAAGTLESNLNWITSLRGRAGFLVAPSLLIYATAGVAWADLEFTLAGSSTSTTFFGYQVGGGTELALSPRTSLRLEYVYTDLEGEDVSLDGSNNTFDPEFHSVRAGFAFKF